MTTDTQDHIVVDETEIDRIEKWCDDPNADCVEIVDHAVPALIAALRATRLALAQLKVISTTIDSDKGHVDRMVPIVDAALGAEHHRSILIADERRRKAAEPPVTAKSVADGLYEQAFGRRPR